MKKEQFTVGGSPALKRAFAKELVEAGLVAYNKDHKYENMDVFIGTHISDPKMFGYHTIGKGRVKYTLPQDWEEAKKAALEFYAEPKKVLPEIGKWYHNGNGQTLFLVISDSNRVGFTATGEWSTGIGKGFDSTLTEATRKEVEERLTAEAKRRYKIGDKVNQKTAYLGKGSEFIITKFEFNFSHYSYVNLAIDGFGVFNAEHGVWADVITPKVEFEKNVWYKNTLINTVAYHTGAKGNYGFNTEGEWLTTINNTDIDQWVKADDKEVESLLIKEAIKRGLVDGCTFTALSSGENWTVSGNIQYAYSSSINTLTLWMDKGETKADGYVDRTRGSLTIFRKGEWVTVVEQPKSKTETKPVIRIGGYDATFNDKRSVSFGCQTISARQIKALVDSFEEYNDDHSHKINSFTIGDNVVSIEELQQINNYLQS